MKVAMVGLGRMGFPMARHMQEAGHDVVGFDESPVALQKAAAAGMVIADGLAGVKDVELVCSSLPATPQVEAVYGQVFRLVKEGTVCADLSTIGVEASRNLAALAADHGIRFLDTPVSGTSIHADAGTLVVMVGGEDDALAVARPALETFASRVEHVGPNGSGLLLKLITNRLLTSHLTAMAEAVLDLEAVGLDVWQGIEMIRSGAVAKLLEYKAAPLVDRDFTPTFTVNLMRKDLGLAAEALPAARVGSLTRQILEEAGELGYGEADLAALIKALETGPTGEAT